MLKKHAASVKDWTHEHEKSDSNDGIDGYDV